MQFHLTKCRAQHPNAEKITCPFNSTHIVNKVELDLHLKWCKERIALDNLVCKVGSDSPFVKPPTLTPVAPAYTSANEVWGEEIAVGESVLDKVKEVSQSKPTFHNKICAPKSERKAHKLNERMRFQQVLDTRTSKAEHMEAKPPHENKFETQKTKREDENELQNHENFSYSESENKKFFSTRESFPRFDEEKGENDKVTANEEHHPVSNYGAVPRDPKNPWATAKPVPSSQLGDIMETAREESRNNFMSSRDENKNNVSRSDSLKSSAPAWGGWSVQNAPSTVAGPESSIEKITSSVHQMNFGERRDPENPWKMKNIAANFDGPANNDFPNLPLSGKGRGKRIGK